MERSKRWPRLPPTMSMLLWMARLRLLKVSSGSRLSACRMRHQLDAAASTPVFIWMPLPRGAWMVLMVKCWD